MSIDVSLVKKYSDSESKGCHKWENIHVFHLIEPESILEAGNPTMILT